MRVRHWGLEALSLLWNLDDGLVSVDPKNALNSSGDAVHTGAISVALDLPAPTPKA